MVLGIMVLGVLGIRVLGMRVRDYIGVMEKK